MLEIFDSFRGGRRAVCNSVEGRDGRGIGQRFFPLFTPKNPMIWGGKPNEAQYLGVKEGNVFQSCLREIGKLSKLHDWVQ
jgi:hypothetical protein